MSERNLWERCRKPLAAFGHLQRVETGLMTGAGVPDVNYCFNGVEGWMELKHGDLPARAATVVFRSQRGLAPAQIEWQLYRRKCGGIVWNLIQVGKWVMLVNGEHAAKINHCTLDELLALAAWKRSGALHAADWKAAVEVLRSVF